MNIIREFAPAKLNLYLHITGRRADGYHDLDSLVAFANVGDAIALEPSDHFRFEIEGPCAERLSNEAIDGNLVVKAVQSLAELVGKPLHIKLILTKNLPIASGIGGGSSDAAAALRALAIYWHLNLDDPRLFAAAARHGQDVPVCLKIANSYLTATGTADAPMLPRVNVLLVNPNKALPTPAVYKCFRDGGFAFSPEARLARSPADVLELIAALKARSNDLYEPARKLMPEIGSIIDALQKTPNCLLARMSGSGATCFGLYASAEDVKQAASTLCSSYPDWWIAGTFLPVGG